MEAQSTRAWGLLAGVDVNRQTVALLPRLLKGDATPSRSEEGGQATVQQVELFSGELHLPREHQLRTADVARTHSTTLRALNAELGALEILRHHHAHDAGVSDLVGLLPGRQDFALRHPRLARTGHEDQREDRQHHLLRHRLFLLGKVLPAL